MATMQERYEKTREFIRDPDVTLVEAIVHSYLWVRFEWHIIQRDKHAKKSKALHERLVNNLDLIQLRKELNQYGK